MNILIISCLAIASLSLFPSKAFGSTDVNANIPQALPISSGTDLHKLNAPNNNKDSELWQEDDREVLIRNERGAKNKNDGGSSVGLTGGDSTVGGKLGKFKKNKNINTEQPDIISNIDGNGNLSLSSSLSSFKLSDNIPDKQSSTQIIQKKIPSSLSSSIKHQHEQQQQQQKQKQRKSNTGQQQQQQQHNNKQKQLKSQLHQTHIKHTNNNNNNNNHNHKNNNNNNNNSTQKAKTLDDEQIPSSCRYVKSAWTECDAKSNTRSRTLTLKKGEEGCVPTRTIQKKCKKACRYEKGSWSECVTGQMTRTDKLKSTSDSTCQPTRVVNKNCNPPKSKDKNNKERKNKDKAGRNKGRA